VLSVVFQVEQLMFNNGLPGEISGSAGTSTFREEIVRSGTIKQLQHSCQPVSVALIQGESVSIKIS